MDDEAKAAIGIMLQCFPQRQETNFDAVTYGFEQACTGIQPGAIVETAQRYVKGIVPKQPKHRPPTPAEFAYEAKKENTRYDGHRRMSSEEARANHIDAIMSADRVLPKPEKTEASKKRVAALVDQVVRGAQAAREQE